MLSITTLTANSLALVLELYFKINSSNLVLSKILLPLYKCGRTDCFNISTISRPNVIDILKFCFSRSSRSPFNFCTCSVNCLTLEFKNRISPSFSFNCEFKLLTNDTF